MNLCVLRFFVGFVQFYSFLTFETQHLRSSPSIFRVVLEDICKACESSTKRRVIFTAHSLQQQAQIPMSIWLISRPCARLELPLSAQAQQLLGPITFPPILDKDQPHVTRLKSREIDHNVLPPASLATFTLFNQFRNHQGTKLTYALPCDDSGHNVFTMDFSA